MDTHISWNRALISFGIPMLLMMLIVLLAKSSIFLIHPKELSIGITFDLVLFIPLVYLVLIRKSEIPKITIVPFFIAGIIIASVIIPKDFQFYLTQVKNWILPIVETTVFFIIIFKIRQLKKQFNKDLTQSIDFYTSLKSVAGEVLPQKISTAFATEIAVIYYGFINWKRRKLNSNEFSYHKNSGTIALLSVFIFLILMETSIVHLLLQKWSIIAAWILSILSFYTALQVFGIMRSMSKRPIILENEKLVLRYGLFSESTIMLSNIENVEISTKSIEFDKTIKKLSPLGELESHNMVIRLKEKTTLFGLYGIKSNYSTIAFYIDEKERFEKELKTALQQMV